MRSEREPSWLEGSAVLFAALGDATRLKLVARLGEGGPQSIARLTQGTGFTRQAIAKHLRVLADAGLASGARRGRESRWALEPDGLLVAHRYLDRLSKRWDSALSRLRNHVEE